MTEVKYIVPKVPPLPVPEVTIEIEEESIQLRKALAKMGDLVVGQPSAARVAIVHGKIYVDDEKVTDPYVHLFRGKSYLIKKCWSATRGRGQSWTRLIITGKTNE